MPFYVGRTVTLQGRGGHSSLTFNEDRTVTVHAPDKSDRPQPEQVGRWEDDPADESHVTVKLGGRRYEYRIENTDSGLRIAPR